MRRLFIVTSAVVALLLAGLITWQMLSERQAAIQQAEEEAGNLASALAEHTRQMLFGFELGMSRVVEEVSELDLRGMDASGRLHALLRTRQRVSPNTFAFIMLDADGRLLASSRTDDVEPVNFSREPEYYVHRDGSQQGMYIGPPRLGRVGHARDQWIINVSSPVRGPDGEFQGVIAAVVSLDELLAFYDTLRIGDSGVVGLFRRDGILIARSPFNERIVGQDFSHTVLFQRRLDEEPTGHFTSAYPSDGERRITAFQAIGDEQAVVFVGLGEGEILAGWRQHVVLTGFLGVLALLVFMGAVAVVGRQVARQRDREQRRAERMQLIAESSASLVRAPDVQSLLQQVTDVARRVIGAHQAVASLTGEDGRTQVINTVSLSEKYREWRDYVENPDGPGLYGLVCETNRPMRLSQAELEAHPDWCGFGSAAERHPPLRGLLAVPMIGQDGGNLGLIQLSDRETGDFTEEDQYQVTQLASIAGVVIDNLNAVEAREHALEEANSARREIEVIFTSISDAVFALDNDWRFVYLNDEAERILECRRRDTLGRNVWEVFPEARETEAYRAYHRAKTEDTPVQFEFYYAPLLRWFSVRAFPHSEGLTVYFQDVTQRMDMEDRLRHVQKMDAVGQLTGGVAHDFNNLLTVILGNAEVALESPQPLPEDVRAQLATIQKAGARATELTSRLLSFARRRALDPRAIDVNRLISGLEELLRRTLEEEIDIELVRGGGLWKAMVDPGELENAILNLALNARDAMPSGGKLTIETANMAVDDTYAEYHEISAGQYVMVAVSDTGQGMDAETLSHAFEPFYTTKSQGRGSGLGLAMVYGFTRQTGGHARLYSEPGEGTTVRLYLPRAAEGDVEEPVVSPETDVLHGKERILVLEDDDLVRQHTVQALEGFGYQVTSRADGLAALALLQDGEYFDLLLTDVVLSGDLSGKQVADRAAALRPEMKVLFMSGYTENAIVHHGRLDPGVLLLSKPFRRMQLARKVREALGVNAGE